MTVPKPLEYAFTDAPLGWDYSIMWPPICDRHEHGETTTDSPLPRKKVERYNW